jgi:hypothetical protein
MSARVRETRRGVLPRRRERGGGRTLEPVDINME